MKFTDLPTVRDRVMVRAPQCMVVFLDIQRTPLKGLILRLA